MKYLVFLMAPFLVLVSSDSAVHAQNILYGEHRNDGSVYHENIQDGDTIVVEGLHGSSKATVTPVSPGVAKIEVAPVYLVSFNSPVTEGKSVSMGSDVSGKGRVYMARAGRRVIQAGHMVCWVGVNITLQACGSFEGFVASAILNVGEKRNQMIVLYPVLKDRGGKQEIALVAHPQNTQGELVCNKYRTMASFVYVDSQGTVSIAELPQIAAYKKTYAAKCQR